MTGSCCNIYYGRTLRDPCLKTHSVIAHFIATMTAEPLELLAINNKAMKRHFCCSDAAAGQKVDNRFVSPEIVRFAPPIYEPGWNSVLVARLDAKRKNSRVGGQFVSPVGFTDMHYSLSKRSLVFSNLHFVKDFN